MLDWGFHRHSWAAVNSVSHRGSCQGDRLMCTLSHVAGCFLQVSLRLLGRAKKELKESSTVIYIYYKVVDQNSFIPERPFFANKNSTFAKLSRTPCLSFAGPMLANNTSYEDSFTTCQITPENHGSLLGSLLNMQLASRSPFSGHIFFAKFTGPPPSTCTLTFARSFA